MNRWTKDILLALATALSFSAFIYLEHYGLTNRLANTLLALTALALLLYIPKRSVALAGFGIGLLWFYWVGYSFKYQELGFMEPLVTLAFGLLYTLYFLPLALTTHPWLRALFLFGLSFIAPLDWNWMQPELLFVNSYIGIYKYQFAIVLIALSLPSLITHRQLRYLPLILLLGALNLNGYHQPPNAPLAIKLVTTDIKQEKKWQPEALYPTIAMVLAEINKAIAQKADVVVLPESVLPLFLNHAPQLLARLQKLSDSITIVTGALLDEDGKNYNVTYIFQNGNYTIAKKLVLVPFGEYIPLPKFAQKFVNDTFFGGASDFLTAKEPTDFFIKKIKFRNAICYEATTQKIYQGDVKYIIAISNNAWFAPSIEPTLQKLLLEYYARKNGVVIYHAANYKGSGVIR